MAELIRHIQKAKRVYFWGTALTSHIPLLRDYIKEGLHNGLEVRFLLVKPSSSAVNMAAFRGTNIDKDELNSTLIRNLSLLNDIAREAQNGRLECKVIDYLSPYTMYIFDHHLPNGHLIAPLSTFRVKNIFRRPTFMLNRKDDEKWFEHFVEQFELVWSEAEVYEQNNP